MKRKDGAVQFPRTAQGLAKPADEKALQLDEWGFTNPNLHRRLDIHGPLVKDEYKSREYEIAVKSTDSFRTTTMHVHDEDSEEKEIP